jgi:hypothetical protein
VPHGIPELAASDTAAHPTTDTSTTEAEEPS